jgi:hypothetical protein
LLHSSAIFASGIILLVPFLYYTTSIPDVCAQSPSAGYLNSGTCGAKTTNPTTGTSKQTCCWKQRTATSAGPGAEITVCQTCTRAEDIRSQLYCTDPVKLATSGSNATNDR